MEARKEGVVERSYLKKRPVHPPPPPTLEIQRMPFVVARYVFIKPLIFTQTRAQGHLVDAVLVELELIYSCSVTVATRASSYMRFHFPRHAIET